MGMTEKIVRRILAAIICLVAIALLAVSFVMPHQELKFNNENVSLVCDGWITQDGEEVTLPVKLPPNESGIYKISRVVGNAGNPGVLAIRSSHQGIRIWCDGELVYEYGNDESKFALFTSPSSAWNLVRLPSDYSDKLVEIELTTYNGYFDGNIGEITIGTKAATLFRIFARGLPQTVAALLSILLGAALLLVQFLLVKEFRGAITLRYLGVLVAVVGIWILGESQMTQFVFSNMNVMSMITFIMFLAIPIAGIRYVMSIKSFAMQGILKAMYWYFTVQALVILLLQLFKIVDILISVHFVNLTIIIMALLLVFTIAYEYITLGEKKILQKIISISIFAIFAVAELVANIFLHNLQSGAILSFGVIVFVVMESIFAIQQLREVYKHGKLADFYKWLSIKDSQTNCLNHREFDRRLETIRMNSKLSIICFDINNLKEINDGFGHQSGDTAITSAAEALNSVFAPVGQCYRIGGDEFAVISEQIEDEEKMRQLISEFDVKISKEDKKLDFELQVAHGYAFYDPALDKTPVDISARADSNMYLNKAAQKDELIG